MTDHELIRALRNLDTVVEPRPASSDRLFATIRREVRSQRAARRWPLLAAALLALLAAVGGGLAGAQLLRQERDTAIVPPDASVTAMPSPPQASPQPTVTPVPSSPLPRACRAGPFFDPQTLRYYIGGVGFRSGEEVTVELVGPDGDLAFSRVTVADDDGYLIFDDTTLAGSYDPTTGEYTVRATAASCSANSKFGPLSAAFPTPTAGASNYTLPVWSVPLSERYASELHGISIAHTPTWRIEEATEPWTTGELPHSLDAPFLDWLGPSRYFPLLGMTSQPIAPGTEDEFVERFSELARWGGERCTYLDDELNVDGAAARLLVDCFDRGITNVFTAKGGRGYLIKSFGHGWLGADVNWLYEMLGTVRLTPEQAPD